MTMCTFAGNTISTARMTRRVEEGSNVFEISFDCIAMSETEIAALKVLQGPLVKDRLLNGKIAVQSSGTSGSLVFNGITYTNCYIESMQVQEARGSSMTVLPYSISFVKDTSI
jgi:hypothetical protein